jgi:hypothetical protein
LVSEIPAGDGKMANLFYSAAQEDTPGKINPRKINVLMKACCPLTKYAGNNYSI